MKRTTRVITAVICCLVLAASGTSFADETKINRWADTVCEIDQKLATVTNPRKIAKLEKRREKKIGNMAEYLTEEEIEEKLPMTANNGWYQYC